MIPVLALIAVAAGLAFAVTRIRSVHHAARTDGRLARAGIETADEAWLDRDLLSADPIGEWLGRYLTPMPR